MTTVSPTKYKETTQTILKKYRVMYKLTHRERGYQKMTYFTRDTFTGARLALKLALAWRPASSSVAFSSSLTGSSPGPWKFSSECLRNKIVHHNSGHFLCGKILQFNFKQNLKHQYEHLQEGWERWFNFAHFCRE
jgi:hypothetical protein